ncbi:ABC transporter permease [Asticcacaulis sp. SL142]|uniref:ABC transporter permease n=1 Tax=Asticcacaulis sp. SL142 TaxID=2995155 RepID=UPI00226C7C17|nr:ABC transporter permease [Asticcacaulis sp. SL142]WAC46857.1 ABC transporter permease [Asticcacaulis sp. SL142]
MIWHLSGFIHVFRSLLRFWGVNLLNVFGLAIGFAAAIVIGLYVKDELSFDRFLPDADNVFIATSVYSPNNSPVISSDKSPAGLARWLVAEAPAVEATARLAQVEWSVRSPRRESLELFYWADPNIFDVLRVKAVSGDLSTALSKPYTMALTQRMALHYFGREDVVGQTLFINGASPIEITAVLADFPPNTSLNREIFVSGLSSYSMLTVLDQHPDWQWASCYVFVRLVPGATLKADTIRNIALKNWQSPHSIPAEINLIPLPDLRFQPEADSQIAPRSHKDTVIAMIAVAGIILFLATVNFAGLLTAQIDERKAEMTIRRTLGARRHHLFFHVISEAVVINAFAAILALALMERLLPVINPRLGTELSVWASPGLAIGFALTAAITGLLGGLYPATILSAEPLRTSHHIDSGRSYMSRVGWIAVQFTLLITLLISSQTVYSQWVFATGQALNFNARNILQIVVYANAGQDESFKKRVLSLDGVEDAAHSRFIPEERNIRPAWSAVPSGKLIQFNRQSVDADFFPMFGVQILAGNNFSGVYFAEAPPVEVILNRSAAEALGYRQPEDAIGQFLDYEADHTRHRSKIIGVVDNMRTNTVRKPLQPMVFDNQSFFFTRLNVRLKPGTEAATLSKIDRLWDQEYPNTNPIYRYFYSDYLSEVYQDMKRQGWAFGFLSVVGICLSILGLTGLSIYLARSRCREIAIRSALGASLADIIYLRLSPFIKPMVIASIAATALSWLTMSLWLSAFDTHISLSPVVFLTSGAMTAFMALATLTAHIILTPPVRASQSLRV